MLPVFAAARQCLRFLVALLKSRMPIWILIKHEMTVGAMASGGPYA